MIRKLCLGAVAAVAVTLSSMAVQAATATFVFNDAYRTWTASPYSFTEGGLTLNVSSNLLSAPDVWDGGAVRTTTENGLEVRGGGSDTNDLIDGSGTDELVRFDFSETVTIKSVTLTVNEDQDQFYYFTDFIIPGTLELVPDPRDANPTGDVYMFSTLFDTSNLFGIGAVGDDVAFGIASLTVEYGNVSAVPLPPAMLLFAGALGGLGWLSRRRKKAQSI